jgi:hypothetical protein
MDSRTVDLLARALAKQPLWDASKVPVGRLTKQNYAQQPKDSQFMVPQATSRPSSRACGACDTPGRKPEWPKVLYTIAFESHISRRRRRGSPAVSVAVGGARADDRNCRIHATCFPHILRLRPASLRRAAREPRPARRDVAKMEYSARAGSLGGVDCLTPGQLRSYTIRGRISRLADSLR